MNPHFTTHSKYFSDPEIFTTNEGRKYFHAVKGLNPGVIS